MKTLLFSFHLLLFCLALGCQPKEDVTPTQIAGKWKLTGVLYRSQIAGQPSSPPQSPPYEEAYEFKSDNTFKRYRSNGYQATGTYAAQHYGEDDHGIVVAFDDEELSYHELVSYKVYSYEKGKVYLRQTGPDVLIESYIASDGPEFQYRRVKD